MKVKFKLKINNNYINKFKKTKQGYFFDIDGVKMTMKLISKTCDIVVGCDECTKEAKLKNLQQLIKLNKLYLCRICRNKGKRNGMFGKKHSKETKEILKKINSGKNNSFYGKKHSKETKLKQREIKLGMYDGEKNPMYGKSVLDVWIEKYGVDDSVKMWIERSENQSKLSSGDNNPMYGRSVLDVWIEKYGAYEANKIHNKWRGQIAKSLKSLYKDNPELRNRISDKLKGRVFTEEHRKNLRLSSIEYIKKKLKLNGGRLVPHFNIEACYFFDKISKIKNINIQHAINNGEYYIEELGYWVDGYDKENNTVYEYYEKFHKYKIEKDLLRESEIKEFLNCDFIIIKEGEEEKFLNNLI